MTAPRTQAGQSPSAVPEAVGAPARLEVHDLRTPRDRLDIGEHIVLFHRRRIIALTGLTAEVFTAAAARAAAGQGSIDSDDLIADIRARHGGGPLAFTAVRAALQELADQDLLSARVFAEDAGGLP